MDTEVKDGGSAFPWSGGEVGVSDGMSLRDYFAGQAVVGYLAAHADGTELGTIEHNAKYAYDMADAMLKARLKK